MKENDLMDRSKKRVLIIDDSLIARKMIGRTIDELNLDTIEAANGKNGFAKVLAKKPDIIILDLLMPEMDGIEFLKLIKEYNMKIPIIVLTSDIQDKVKDECYSLGAYGFLNKPPRKEDIFNLLKPLIETEKSVC